MGDRSLSARPRWERHRWRVLGGLTVLGLTVVDALGAGLVADPAAANLSGTLALAPTMTALGGTRRDVLQVGGLALVVAALLAVRDGVPAFPAVTRWVVVLVVTLVMAATARQLRARQDRELAAGREGSRTLQGALVGQLPQPDHLALASRYLPASQDDQVGGDWCDVVIDLDGCVNLFVGDVVGHDLRAAASMGVVRDVLRAYAVEGEPAPHRLLARTEGTLERLGVEVLATAVVARIDLRPPSGGGGAERRVLTWSSAGHPPPILLHADGRAQVLDTDAGLMLGIGFGPGRRDQSVEFPDGATVVFYTDGLVENRRSDLAAGTRRLLESLARHEHEHEGAGVVEPVEPAVLLDAVLAELVGPAAHDDIAVLAVRARA